MGNDFKCPSCKKGEKFILMHKVSNGYRVGSSYNQLKELYPTEEKAKERIEELNRGEKFNIKDDKLLIELQGKWKEYKREWLQYLEESYKADLGEKEFDLDGNLRFYCMKCKNFSDSYDFIKMLQEKNKKKESISDKIDDIN